MKKMVHRKVGASKSFSNAKVGFTSVEPFLLCSFTQLIVLDNIKGHTFTKKNDSDASTLPGHCCILQVLWTFRGLGPEKPTMDATT